MADKQLIQYSGQNYGDKYTVANAIFSIKTAKTYDELEAALTINYISQLDIFDNTIAEKLRVFNRGYLQRALGQGIRFIETYGLLQTKKFTPLQPGSKACLEVPNNIFERSETIGKLTRVFCSCKDPDFLDAYNRFTDPNELVTFTQQKIGNIKQSVSFFLNLLFEYVLAICPWSDANADHFNNFTLSSVIGMKWNDTAIGQFGDNNEGVGALLKDLEQDLKVEIDKEKKLPNVNVDDVWNWCPALIAANSPAEMRSGKKIKKPTAKIDKEKLKKMYLDNKKVDPTLAMASIANCLNYHIEMMTNEVTAQNDAQFPGNTADKMHEYGKDKNTDTDLTACPQKGSGKREGTKSLYNPCKVKKEDLVIIMNSELYKAMKSAVLTSEFAQGGMYKAHIQNFMQYDANIIPISTISYGAVKIGSKDRYHQWDLYDKIETDRLGQFDLVVHTAHRGIAFGIREYVPFKYIRLTGLPVNSMVKDVNIEFNTPQDL